MFSLPLLLGLLFSVTHSSAAQSPKRGLVFVPNTLWPQDDAFWTRQGSGLTWYYNFGWQPSTQYANVSSSTIQFVPMLWGTTNDTWFAGNVTKLIDSGHNITHVLSFNEPDAGFSEGGSSMEPADAADVWINNLVPLQEKGIKVSLPVVKQDAGPHAWIDPFLANCTEKLGKNCTFDFVPLHSYGNFTTLKSRVETFSSAFPDTPIWLTEYGYSFEDLNTTQDFFNKSVSYLDSNEAVERYAWFGAFRSLVSNVGANSTFLDPSGNLTDIGSWYLGGNATGRTPVQSTSTSTNSSCSSTNPCGKQNAGSHIGNAWYSWLAGLTLLSVVLQTY